MASENEHLYPVQPGRHVELEITYEGGDVEQFSLDIVPDAAADFAKGMLGESTPLAKAVAGQTAGSVIPYREGDALQVRILSVTDELRGKPVDLTERRQETHRKAVRQSDQTNLIIFASSVNNKWGDYDPGVIQDEEEEQRDASDGPEADDE